MKRIVLSVLLAAAAAPVSAKGAAFAQLQSWAGGEAAGPLLVFLPPAPLSERAQKYAVVLDKSVFECTAYSGPFSASGTFRRYSVEAFLDFDQLTNSRVMVTLEAASIVSEGFLIPDVLLRGQLQADVYPVATMQTLAIRGTGTPGLYEADVVLGLMGESYKKTILINVAREGHDVRLSGTIEIDLAGGLRGMESYSILVRRVPSP